MITILALIVFFEAGSNTIYGFEFNSLGTNRGGAVNYILNNKVYFSTSSINLGDRHNQKSVVFYFNADVDKEKIVRENKNKSGVYRWTNLNTRFTYVGSSVNLVPALKKNKKKFFL